MHVCLVQANLVTCTFADQKLATTHIRTPSVSLTTTKLRTGLSKEILVIPVIPVIPDGSIAHS